MLIYPSSLITILFFIMMALIIDSVFEKLMGFNMLNNVFSELIVKCNDHDKLRNFCRMPAGSQSPD